MACSDNLSAALLPVAEYGEVDLMKHLFENGVKFSFSAIGAAARGGNTEMLRYFQELGYPLQQDQACTEAARSGHEETVCVLFDPFPHLLSLVGIFAQLRLPYE